MALNTTLGRLLINEALPKNMRDYEKVWDKPEMKQQLVNLASEHPEQYSAVMDRLMSIGRSAATTGNFSFSLKDFKSPAVKKVMVLAMKGRINKILQNRSLTPEKQQEKIVDLLADQVAPLTKAVLEDSYKSGSRLAEIVRSGSKGSPGQFNTTVGAPLLYVNHKDEPVPIPVFNSVSEGLDPVEYWASTYGTRKGTLSTKMSVAEAGDFGKKLGIASNRLMVTEDDCGTTNGIPVEGDDPANIGSVLQMTSKGIPAGTVLGAEHLKRLRGEEIVVRSPITCQASEGMCSRCSGIREKGRFPDIGENIGVTAAAAMGEKLSQSMLSCLSEGTMVRMADMTCKPIEQIVVGDVVIGSDKYGNTEHTLVTNTYDNGVQPCCSYTYSSDGSAEKQLVCTSAHKVASRRYTPSGGTYSVCPIGELDAGSELVTSAGGALNPVVRESAGKLHTYDIEVAHPSHLFLLENGMIVSNSKHTAGALKRKTYDFYDIERLFEMPKSNVGFAPVAETTGKVIDIKPSSAGGVIINVNGSEHWAADATKLNVKPGDMVEAGDVLSDGIPNPSIVAKYRGIGEARMEFLNSLKKVTGGFVNRRNGEVLARALVKHVKATSLEGPSDTVVDDMFAYDNIVRDYKPRDDSKMTNVELSHNTYLDQPALHYSIGTKVTPRVVKYLKGKGVKDVLVNKAEPNFAPAVQRMSAHSQLDPDWMTRLAGYHLMKSLPEAVHRGASSEEHSTSFVPSLASGLTFGKDIETTGKY